MRAPRVAAWAALGVLLCGHPAAAGILRISEDTRWEGKVVRDGDTFLLKGATLTVAPGAEITIGPGSSLVIEGRLIVEGRADAPVTIRGAGPAGGGGEGRFKRILLVSPGEEHRFEHCSIEGAGEGIAAIGSPVAVRNVRFRDCGVAVGIEGNADGVLEGVEISGTDVGLTASMRSRLLVRRLSVREGRLGAMVATSCTLSMEESSFEGLEAGSRLSEIREALVKGNRFTDCRIGLAGVNVGDGVLFEGNAITGCQTGIEVKSFAVPRLRGNLVTGCEKGLDIYHFSAPEVTGNRLEGNRLAVSVSQKSPARILGNVITGNDVGISLNLSSYPAIHFNAFLRNPIAIRLEEMESADWELKVGSGRLTRAEAARVGSRRIPTDAPDDAGKAGSPRLPDNNFLDGWVDARWNWWGEETRAILRKGPGADLRMIDDVHDRPVVTYEGFAGSYALDRVEYWPVLDEPWENPPAP